MQREVANPGWTPDRVEMLKKLCADGLTAARIAAELGYVTRNAVIGKINRLGLMGRTTGRPRRNKPAAAHPWAKGEKKPPHREEPEFALATSLAPITGRRNHGQGLHRSTSGAERHRNRVSEGALNAVMSLTPQTCRFPVGDPRDDGFSFCGAQKEGGSPYCTKHAHIAFVREPATKAKEAA